MDAYLEGLQGFFDQLGKYGVDDVLLILGFFTPLMIWYLLLWGAYSLTLAIFGSKQDAAKKSRVNNMEGW